MMRSLVQNRVGGLLVALFLLVGSWTAQAAPFYQSVSLDYAQTDLTITPAAPGFRLWDVSATVTNNTGSALQDVSFWLLGLLLNTGNGLLPAEWINAEQLFRSPEAVTAAPSGNTGFVLFSQTDLVAPASSSIEATDSLAVWNLGPMAIGQTVAFNWAFLSETAVGEVRPNTGNYIGFTNTVSEPGTLAIAGFALLALGLSRRRRR